MELRNVFVVVTDKVGILYCEMDNVNLYVMEMLRLHHSAEMK
jgi:hypothetical protein